MKKLQIKATSLKTTMLVVIFALAVVLVGGFYYAQVWLSDFANSSNVDSSKPKAGALSPAELTQLNSELSSQKPTSIKANKILASLADYKTKIQQDLSIYATNTGVKVTQYDPAPSLTSKPDVAMIPGVQSNFVKITLENPVDYTSLIKFIKAIESNLPKMKLTGINITRSDSSDTSVNVDPITIEVYTR